MACSKQFSITVDEDDSPDPDCPLLNGEIWTAPIGATTPGVFAPDPGYPPSVGDAIMSGTGAEFSGSATIPPFQAEANYAAVETSFIYAGSDRVFTVAIDYTIVGSLGNAYFEVWKNGLQIFYIEAGFFYPSSAKHFQLFDTDAGATILIRAALGRNNPTDTTRSFLISGRITCEEGIGNEERSAHVDCGPECVPGGTGGDWTVPAGTVLRPTLAEANLAAEALALARATGQSQLPENCCCMQWGYQVVEIPPGTIILDSNVLVATYQITAVTSFVPEARIYLDFPDCAIPPGATQLTLTLDWTSPGGAETLHSITNPVFNFPDGPTIVLSSAETGSLAHTRGIYDPAFGGPVGGTRVSFSASINGTTGDVINGTATLSFS